MPIGEVHLTIECWPEHVLALMAPAALIKQIPSSALGHALQGTGVHAELLDDERTIMANVAESDKSPREIERLLQSSLTALFNSLGCTVSVDETYGL